MSEEYTTIMEKGYEKSLSLQNRYSFLNANILGMLKPDEKDFLIDTQAKCIKLSKDVAEMESVYDIIPKLGEDYLLQRLNPHKGMEGNSRLQMLLTLCTTQLSPQVDMAMAASAILGGNALSHVHNPNAVVQKAIDEIFSGKKIGCIGITEMEHGSDAVNMETTAKINEDGSMTMNGTKIYTTNGPAADYYVAYGVTDISNPRFTMTQGLFTSEHGVKAERLCIPAAPKVHIGKTMFENVTCPKDYVLAGPGVGYRRLFAGLVPERLTIVGSSVGGLWAGLAHAAIFSQLRTQFGKPIFKYQGISHVISDLFSKTSAYTSFAFQICDHYEKTVASKIRAGKEPNRMDEQYCAVLASQAKYLTAKAAHYAAYELVQTMGGRGALDEPGSNLIINELENLSRISEVVGGHRNVQLMITDGALRMAASMNIGRFKRKFIKNAEKTNEKKMKLMVERAENMIENQKDALGDAAESLERALNSLKKAVAEKDEILIKTWARQLPKELIAAGKAIYKHNK